MEERASNVADLNLLHQQAPVCRRQGRAVSGPVSISCARQSCVPLRSSSRQQNKFSHRKWPAQAAAEAGRVGPMAASKVCQLSKPPRRARRRKLTSRPPSSRSRPTFRILQDAWLVTCLHQLRVNLRPASRTLGPNDLHANPLRRNSVATRWAVVSGDFVIPKRRKIFSAFCHRDGLPIDFLREVAM